VGSTLVRLDRRVLYIHRGPPLLTVRLTTTEEHSIPNSLPCVPKTRPGLLAFQTKHHVTASLPRRRHSLSWIPLMEQSIPAASSSASIKSHHRRRSLSGPSTLNSNTRTVYDSNMMSPQTSTDALHAQVPNLPAKNSRRMTTLLASLPHKIDAEDQATVLSQATPHDHYLSSEEDASSSADDLSDYSFDSDDDDLSPLAEPTPARQVTARAVSVVYSGKPSIVNLPRRSASPTESSPSRPVTSRSTETLAVSNPSFAKRMSILSFRSATLTSGRPNSVILGLGGERRPARPNFLDSDPFPSSVEEPLTSPRLPKAPGAMMLKRTFNLVKRKSRPRLNHAATLSRESLAQFAEEDSPSPAPAVRSKLQHSSTMPLITSTSPISPSRLRGLSISRKGLKA
jgi:hypothetical protein